MPLTCEQLGEQRDDHGQGQVAVRDGAAERAGRGAGRVHVDPLVVAGRVGEGVHPLLGHLGPAGAPEVGASQRGDLLQAVHDGAHAVVPPCVSRSCFLRILPVAVRGKPPVKRTDLGILYRARRPSRKAQDVGFRRAQARVQHDHGAADLTPPAVRDPDHPAVGHRGVAEQGVLHLRRVDVLPAGNDHVLDAVHHGHVAVLVRGAHVAGAQPAVREHRGGRLRAGPSTPASRWGRTR